MMTEESKSKALLIDPNTMRVDLIDLEHRQDEGAGHIQELLDAPLFESAPNHPATGDILIVADTFSYPQPDSKSFRLPYVMGSITGKALIIGVGTYGEADDVKLTVEQITSDILWEAG